MRRLLGERLEFDGRTVAVTLISTLLLLISSYWRITNSKPLDSALFYLVVPLAVIVAFFRERPSEYGFRLGDWRTGLLLTAILMIIAAPLVLFAAQAPAMKHYYASGLQGLPWTTFVDLLGWEFFFRGWILTTYARRYGPDAIWLQAVPFALAHLGKPAIETVSTIFGGFVFGWLAYRTRSFLYPFLLHWFVNTLVILAAAGVLG